MGGIFVPAARFAMRQSLRWTHLAPALGVLSLSFLYWSDWPQSRFSLLGVFALVYALPFAATRFIEADRDGRQDHLRLLGQPEGRLLASLALGWSGSWLVLGLVSLLVWWSTQQVDLSTLLFVAALCGGSVALSLLALALPRGEVGPDARIVAVGLAGVALMAAVAPLSAVGSIPGASGRSSLFITITCVLLIVECVVSAVCLPAVLRALARPAVSAHGRGPMLPVLAGYWWPEMNRIFNVCFLPAVLIGLMAGALLAVFRLVLPSDLREADWLFITFASYAPLALCAFVISTGARADRESGRFELLRLRPERPALTLLAVAAGACLPFLLATAAVHGWVWALWGQRPAGFALAVIATAIVAPAAGVEGWMRRWPLVYTAPLAAIFVSGLATRRDLGASWYLVDWNHIGPLLIAWIPWAAAIRVFRRPEQPPLNGAMAIVVATCVAAVYVRMRGPIGIDAGVLCATLLVIAGFMVDLNRHSWIERVGPGLAGGIVTGTIVLLSGQSLFGAVVLGASPLIAWLLAWRVHRWAGQSGWSAAVRVLIAFVIGSPLLYSLGIFQYFAPYPSSRNVVDRLSWIVQTYIVWTSTLLALAALVETAYLVSRRIKRTAS